MSALPSPPFIYPLTDRRLAGLTPIRDIIGALCRGGARMIQLREKNLTTRELTAVAEAAVEAAHKSGALLIVNDRADVALYAGADGVHLGGDELPAAAARKILGEGSIIGVSCHSIGDVRRALTEPINYFAVGPVFATDTKELRYAVVGLQLVRAARAETDMPFVAIGGIGPETARQVVEAGADGVAVISAVMAPDGIEDRTKEMFDAIGAV